MRANRSHTGNRRAHHALTAPRLSIDSKTGATHQRHRLCMITGKYRGVQILDIAGKMAKKQKKIMAKQTAALPAGAKA